MKRFAAGAVLLALIVGFCSSCEERELSAVDEIFMEAEAAAKKAGFDLAGLEEIKAPVVYSDEAGNTIVYHRYFCTDPERISSGNASFYSEVFDPDMADSVITVVVNGNFAFLYEMDGRAYLIWYPNDSTILMLDYDPKVVSGEGIVKMAESV